MGTSDETVIEACFSDASATKLSAILLEGGSANAVDVTCSILLFFFT